MHWLYLLLAAICLIAAAKAPGWLVVLLLIAALIFMLAWIVGWLSSRISSGARNDSQIIAPEELRRLREQAEARKAAAQKDSPPPPGA